jgi:hypothetical protein
VSPQTVTTKITIPQEEICPARRVAVEFGLL